MALPDYLADYDSRAQLIADLNGLADLADQLASDLALVDGGPDGLLDYDKVDSDIHYFSGNLLTELDLLTPDLQAISRAPRTTHPLG